jgi:hypothetical protein
MYGNYIASKCYQSGELLREAHHTQGTGESGVHIWGGQIGITVLIGEMPICASLQGDLQDNPCLRDSIYSRYFEERCDPP